MTIKLSHNALEGSTYVVIPQFYAKRNDGTPPSSVVPNDDLTWSLRDENGQIVNNRDGVSVPTGESVNIVLRGDDLRLSGTATETRTLTIVGTFDSLYGAGLPLLDEYEFDVENAVGVAPPE